MIAAILGLLSGGTVSRVELYGVFAAGALALGWLWLHEHDARLLAQQAARARAVVAAQQLRDAHAATAAVQRVADAAIRRARTLAQVKMEVAHAAPPAAACAVPAAVLRAVGALRASP